MLGAFIKYRYLVIALVWALSLFGLYLWARFDAYNSCKSEFLEAQIKATHEAIGDKNEAKRIVDETTDIDKLLSDLGIMRANDDR